VLLAGYLSAVCDTVWHAVGGEAVTLHIIVDPQSTVL